MKTIAKSLVIAILCVCCLSKSGLAEGAPYLAILEDQDQEPDALAVMHDKLAALRLQIVRPLQGRLAGLGNLWALPWDMWLAHAVQAVSTIEGVASTQDPKWGTDRYECIQRVPVSSGRVRIEFRPDDRETAAEALANLGFTLRGRSYCFSFDESWDFFPIEYTVPEAVEAAGAVPGVAQVNWNPFGLPGDAAGDVYDDCVINILDLIGIRNHLNEDPCSPPDNQVYDANEDGSINILDMIYVRNRLNHMCREEPYCP